MVFSTVFFLFTYFPIVLAIHAAQKFPHAPVIGEKMQIRFRRALHITRNLAQMPFFINRSEIFFCGRAHRSVEKTKHFG